MYNHRYNYLYSAFASSSSVDGQVSVGHNRTFTTNQQYLANYSNTIADVHNFSILAGYEQYNYKDQLLSGSNDHLYHPGIGELDNALGADKKTVGSSTDNLAREGFLGRVQYDYDGKYFGSASIRRDASSIFAPGPRWGTFGSVGAAWQINKESFMEDVDWVFDEATGEWTKSIPEELDLEKLAKMQKDEFNEFLETLKRKHK